MSTGVGIQPRVVRRLDMTGNKEQRMTRPWANLFAQNQNASKGMSLSFIPPTLVEGKPVVHLEAAEIEKNT